MDQFATTLPALSAHVQSMEARLFGPHQAQALEALDPVLPHLQQGFASFEATDVTEGVQMFRTLWRYLLLCAQLPLGIALAQQLLNKAERLSEEQYAEMLIFQNLLRYYKKDHKEVGDWVSRYFIIAPKWRSELMDAFAHLLRGWSRQCAGLHDAGRMELSEAAQRFEQEKHLWGQAWAELFFANLERSRMRLTIARQHYQKAQQGFEQLGDVAAQAEVVGQAGICELLDTNFVRAEHQLATALKLCRSHQFHLLAAEPMLGLAAIRLKQDLPKRAAMLCALSGRVQYSLGIGQVDSGTVTREKIAGQIAKELGAELWKAIQSKVNKQPLGYWIKFK